MKKHFIISLLFLFSFQTLFSQGKQIKGDTLFWSKDNIELKKNFELKDFEKSSDEFNFRFRNHGQIIEISKDSMTCIGSLTNYIYHTKNSNKNTATILSNKIILTSKQVKNIYDIVQKSEILNLPSDKDIKNWNRGADGITYVIEHADKKNYYIKKYWTPSAEDSIPEAKIVLNLIKNLSDTLKLQEKYSSFKNTLPKKGCYNSGGIANMCYISNSLELGYSGTAKLPLGFYSSYSATYVGNTKINGSVSLQYNFDNGGFHNFNLQLAKWYIFYTNSNLSDFIAFNYQNRILNINETINKFENYQIKYGLNLKKNIGVGIGIDYLISSNNKIGEQFFVSKWFSKPNISTVFTTSVFENQVNYKAEIFKSFGIHRFPIHRVSLGLAYEDFMDYKDLYFSLRLLL